MPFVRLFRKAKMIQKYLFCEISARQKLSKSPILYQKPRHFSSEIMALPSRNHLEKLQKSPRKVEEITATSCGNHLEKLRKVLGKIRSKD
jgi:hypothetical protein